MSLRDAHVPAERLTVLALGSAEAASPEDQAALVHATECQACGRQLAELTAQLGSLRLEAFREADTHFDEAALEGQRTRILDRLAHLGQSARVLPFPGTLANRGSHSGVVNRRWISAAAAAGLLIGILTGQLLQLIPGDRVRARATEPVQQVSSRGVAPPAVAQAAASMTLSDEDLLGEIDVAVQRRRAAELMALDALTPTTSEIR